MRPGVVRARLLAALLLPALVAAQTYTAEQEEHLKAVFARYDGSGDGIVRRAEFPGSDEQFKALDPDGDGAVSWPEFRASAGAKRLILAREAARREPRARTTFEALLPARLGHVARFDRDRDGRVTPAEWTGSATAFRTLDANGDGVLDGRDRKLAERDATAATDPLAAVRKALPSPEELFAKHDRDKDGTLSARELPQDIVVLMPRFDRNRNDLLEADEVAAMVGAVAEVIRRRDLGAADDRPRAPEIPFATWDKDKDGRLDKEEFEMRYLFVRVDLDRDGYVTKSEIERFKRSIEGSDFVDRYDLNGDGKVTPDEFGGAGEVFRRLDRNGDGTVTRRE